MTRWDVCWANVKYEDSDKTKKRPVLIINSNVAYILAFKMTHKERSSELEYQLQDWKAANLNEPTTVRLLKKIEFKPNDNLTYIGKLAKQDIDNIKKLLQRYQISMIK